MAGLIVLLALAAAAAALVISGVRIVKQSTACVVERLGKYLDTWGVGVHFKLPLADRIVRTVSLKEQVLDFPPQPVITKDNVTIQIDVVLYCLIREPRLYVYGVEDPMTALENLVATTLRNICGELELDQSLTGRDHINGAMRAAVDEATDKWGLSVTRVEIRNIIPPREIQDAMEKQMKAERERREAILRAEGQKQSDILIAEGEKQAALLKADAERQAAVMTAEGRKKARILDAEAESVMISRVEKANADAIRLINQAEPGPGALQLRALDAFRKAADGQATKIIIPSEIQSLAGLCAGAGEIFASAGDTKCRDEDGSS